MNYLKIEKGRLLSTAGSNMTESSFKLKDQKDIDKLNYYPVVIPYMIDNIHVFIHCPYCQREHRHGSGGGKKPNGHRLSHCCETTGLRHKKNNVGYVILQEDTIVMMESGVIFQVKDLASSFFLETGSHTETYLDLINKIHDMGKEKKTDDYGALEMD